VEFGGLDDDGAAEAVTDEGEFLGADAAEEGAAGEHIEDALFEHVGLAVVDAEHGDAGVGEEGREAGVQAVCWAIEAAHGTADADDGGCPAFDGMEDAVDGAAGGFEADAERAGCGFDGQGADAEDAEVEVLGLFRVVPHVAGHWREYTSRADGMVFFPVTKTSLKGRGCYHARRLLAPGAGDGAVEA
jgi:hypothetical protein